MCDQHDDNAINRRQALTGGAALAAATAGASTASAQTAEDTYQRQVRKVLDAAGGR
jgi:hypothetical protein